MQKYFGVLGVHMVLGYVVSGKQKEMEIGGCGREPGGHIGILARGHSMGWLARNTSLGVKLVLGTLS